LKSLWDISYAPQGDSHVKRLKLDDNEHSENARLLSSDLELPEDLPSVEEQLRVLVVLYIGCAVFECKKMW